MTLSAGAHHAPGGAGAGTLFVHEVRKDGKIVARLEGSSSGTDGAVVVQATVTPVGKGTEATVTQPFTFAQLEHARRFADDALESFEFLGCEIVD